MRLGFIAPLLAAAAVAGCATQPPKTVDDRAMIYVPSGSQIHEPQRPINAYAVLPGTDDPHFFVPRGEKVAYGATYLGGFSAYTTYTHDAQAIFTPFGSGYRYRWVVEEGLSAPAGQ